MTLYRQKLKFYENVTGKSCICVITADIKVNGDTFKGRNSSIFAFASSLNGAQLLKERICSSKSNDIYFSNSVVVRPW